MYIRDVNTFIHNDLSYIAYFMEISFSFRQKIVISEHYQHKNYVQELDTFLNLVSLTNLLSYVFEYHNLV